MIGLKEYLIKETDKQISDCEEEILLLKQIQGDLREIDINNATYTITLTSLWEKEGETSTETKHKGNLLQAIQKAEREFKEANNNRSDVQAKYGVEISVGEEECSIPEEYWEGFKEKER